jgi:hypothetical protein
MKRSSYLIRIFLLIAASRCVASAQDRVLIVQVNDAQDHPISGVRLSTKGEGSIGAPTDVAGKTRIRLASQTREEGSVSLQLVDIEDGRDLVFMQPWDGRVTVPAFKNDSENFVLVVLIPRRLRLFIESGGGPQESLVASLSRRSAQPTTKKGIK